MAVASPGLIDGGPICEPRYQRTWVFSQWMQRDAIAQNAYGDLEGVQSISIRTVSMVTRHLLPRSRQHIPKTARSAKHLPIPPGRPCWCLWFYTRREHAHGKSSLILNCGGPGRHLRMVLFIDTRGRETSQMKGNEGYRDLHIYPCHLSRGGAGDHGAESFGRNNKCRTGETAGLGTVRPG